MTQDSNPSENFRQVSIKSPQGDQAKICEYGAQVLSWSTGTWNEQIFLSPKADFRPGAAIRGGVPIIFPQFASQGRLAKHGFARNLPWELASIKADRAVFWLSETPETYKIWAHRFLAEYQVLISNNKLELALSITNTDITPFSFTAALHTYLMVKDSGFAKVVGLEGKHYLDSTNSGADTEDTVPQITFSGEVDRIYPNSPNSLSLVDEVRAITIQSYGFTDAVIWNPGAEKCADLADMEPGGYKRFVCVESASVVHPVRLAPGENWRGMQTLLV